MLSKLVLLPLQGSSSTEIAQNRDFIVPEGCSADSLPGDMSNAVQVVN